MWRVYNLRHTTMFTYSHANTPLGQSERAYYLSYFIIIFVFVCFGWKNIYIKLIDLINLVENLHVTKKKFIICFYGSIFETRICVNLSYIMWTCHARMCHALMWTCYAWMCHVWHPERWNKLSLTPWWIMIIVLD